VLVAGGAVLAAGLIALVVVAGLRVGHSGAASLARAGGGLAGGGGFAAAPSTAPPSAAPVGDDPGLDGYAQRCHDGLLSACDDLSFLSLPSSDYQRYGMTCGGRVGALTVATCEDLDGD